MYSGHASNSGRTAWDWLLAGPGRRSSPITHKPIDPTVNWWCLRSLLEEYAGDVCYIFDSCSARSGVIHEPMNRSIQWRRVYGSVWVGTEATDNSYCIFVHTSTHRHSTICKARLQLWHRSTRRCSAKLRGIKSRHVLCISQSRTHQASQSAETQSLVS